MREGEDVKSSVAEVKKSSGLVLISLEEAVMSSPRSEEVLTSSSKMLSEV